MSQGLIDAADDCDFNQVKELIKEGIDVNKQNVLGRTALHLAAIHGCTEIAKLLIDAGADVNIRDEAGATPWYLAAYYGYTEIARLLIIAKADPVIPPKNDLKEENKIIEAVINRKDKDGYTLIMGAVEDYQYSQNIKLIQFFIDKGADLSVTYPDGQTLIEKAIQTNNTELIKLLFEASETKNYISPAKRLSNLNLIAAAQNGNIVTVNNALKAGADINTKDKIGCTPLIWAVNGYEYGLAEFLIEQGADVTIRDNDGDTALSIIADGLVDRSATRIISMIEKSYIEKYNNK